MYKALIEVSKEKLQALEKKRAEEILIKILIYIDMYWLISDEKGLLISSRNNDDDIRLFCVELSDDESLLPYLKKIWMIDNNGKYEDCIEGHYEYLKVHKNQPYP